MDTRSLTSALTMKGTLGHVRGTQWNITQTPHRNSAVVCKICGMERSALQENLSVTASDLTEKMWTKENIFKTDSVGQRRIFILGLGLKGKIMTIGFMVKRMITMMELGLKGTVMGSGERIKAYIVESIQNSSISVTGPGMNLRTPRRPRGHGGDRGTQTMTPWLTCTLTSPSSWTRRPWPRLGATGTTTGSSTAAVG